MIGTVETPSRIEPTRLPSISEELADTLSSITRASTILSERLHPTTAANLADLLRLTNSYYSNLIEGLWSISRGLSRGLSQHPSYKAMMDAADAPRAGDLDGRGNLSLAALAGFVQWFCDVMLDQLTFMTEQLEFNALDSRLESYVERDLRLPSTATAIAQDVLRRGEVPRGEAGRITGLRDRAARDVLGKLISSGLLASVTPKGPVSLRISTSAAEILFPRLF